VWMAEDYRTRSRRVDRDFNKNEKKRRGKKYYKGTTTLGRRESAIKEEPGGFLDRQRKLLSPIWEEELYHNPRVIGLATRKIMSRGDRGGVVRLSVGVGENLQSKCEGKEKRKKKTGGKKMGGCKSVKKTIFLTKKTKHEPSGETFQRKTGMSGHGARLWRKSLKTTIKTEDLKARAGGRFLLGSHL